MIVLPDSLTVDSKKLTEYLLNPDHATGGPKARFFLGLGFSAARIVEFADALFTSADRSQHRWHQAPVNGLERIVCVAPLVTPLAQVVWVRTVWEIELDQTARLITAYPDREPKAKAPVT